MTTTTELLGMHAMTVRVLHAAMATNAAAVAALERFDEKETAACLTSTNDVLKLAVDSMLLRMVPLRETLRKRRAIPNAIAAFLAADMSDALIAIAVEESVESIHDIRMATSS